MTNYGCSSKIDKNDPRQKLWKKQRKERGFDDTELWNLDVTFAQFMLPRIEAFRNSNKGCPGCFSNIEEWNKVLDQIIVGFRLIINDEYYFADLSSPEGKKIDKAIKLFSKYVYCMWN